MVGAHPFGGFNMSGTDSKAGGPDYLLLFTQAKSVAEKVAVAASPLEELTEQKHGSVSQLHAKQNAPSFRGVSLDP